MSITDILNIAFVLWFVYINACVDNHRTRLKVLEKERGGES